MADASYSDGIFDSITASDFKAALRYLRKHPQVVERCSNVIY